MTILLREHASEAATKEKQANGLLSSLGVETLTLLSPKLETVTLKTGEQLYPSEVTNEHVYFPNSAVISHIRTSLDGESVEVGMVGSEGASGITGLLNRVAPLHAAVVVFGGQAVRIRTEDLVAEMHNDRLLHNVMFDYLVQHIAQVTQRVACESFHLADERLCTWLLMLHDRVRTNRLTITHEEISSFIGISRSSVSVIAKSLRDDRIINYVRGKFYILDRTGLEKTACDCYSAVQSLN
jgi:CRP-like cAMP-binding protein